MRILGIETSCDETAASIIEGRGDKIKVLSNIISSQIEIHKKYGGVVPEVAAREHVLNILPVVNEALNKAGIKREEASKKIDAISVATGPGLVTSLIAGIETAKILSYAWNIPVISVNHIEGHIYANYIDSENIKLPALILTVSGGHTQLVLMIDHGAFTTVGETRDDAAGEAFDKAAAMMKIGYPGGPNVAFQATKVKSPPPWRGKQKSKVKSIVLPRPMINSKDYDFSFSGLKTAILYELQKDPTSPFNSKGLRGAGKNWKKRIPEYCAEFQQAVIDVLIKKTLKAAKDLKVKTVMLSGGVSANKELRDQMEKAVEDSGGIQFTMPDLKYTTDNAAMIAAAGYYKARDKKFTPWKKLKVNCNAEI